MAKKVVKDIIPVVAACILEGCPLRILLHKKDEPRNPELLDKWEFPGGMMQYRETPQQALQREIKEELGITIQVDKLLYAQTNIYTDQVHYLVLFYVCYTRSQSIPEHCKYFAPGDIFVLDCLPGTFEVVRKILELGYK